MDKIFIAFSILGLIGIMVSLFQIISSFRKNRKWGKYTKLAIFLGIVAISILGFTRESEDKVEVKENNNISRESIEDTAIESENKIQEVEAEEELSIQKKEEFALNKMEEVLNGFAKVSLDRNSKTFKILPTGEAKIALSLFRTFQKNNKDLREKWNYVTSNLIEVSQSMEKDLPSYHINIVDPNNTNKEILSVYKGEILYNFVDDF